MFLSKAGEFWGWVVFFFVGGGRGLKNNLPNNYHIMAE